MYADVIVDISNEKLDRVFQYKVPAEMLPDIRPGVAVIVPFGKGDRHIRGFVIGTGETCAYDPGKIKEIAQIAADTSASDRLVRLAVWMKEHYGGATSAALRTVLVFKNKQKAAPKRILRLLVQEERLRDILDAMPNNKRAQKRLLVGLQMMPEMDYRVAAETLHISKSVADALCKQGLIEVVEQIDYRRPNFAGAMFPHTGFPHIASQPTGSPHICEDHSEDHESVRDAAGCRDLPPLNRGQRSVMERFLEGEKRGRHTYVLQGVTGSGKTRVYIEMIRHVLSRGQQAIVLIPEIALTFQTMQRFYAYFGDRVSMLHSRMSDGERYDQMEMAKKGMLDIMIGPRSALFTPFSDLGLIVIDEEHEGSYKSEQTPRYHAVDTAVYRSKLESCSVILGSATPSITTMYRARRGEYTLLRLSERIGGRDMADVHIVDMRAEMRGGNGGLLSRRLSEAIRERLTKGEQVMLFLNRRGYAGFLSCRSCGEVVTCPHCDVSLSLHNDGRLICHYCGYEREHVRTCPSCGSSHIGAFKAGTQQVEETVQKMFPESRLLRMDRDTTSKKGSHESILRAFSEGKADILIGTQMIVKGHDFPNVTLVGVLLADLSLHSGDYMAAERTFSLLTQACGRAGRGEKSGEAIIQTYEPEHYAVVAAREQNYDFFYEKEIAYRAMLSYPPVGTLLAVQLSHEDESHLDKAMRYFSMYAKHAITGVEQMYATQKRKENDGGAARIMMLGPSEASIYRLNRMYRKTIYFKCMEYDMLIALKDMLEAYVEINTGFSGIYLFFDFNPNGGF